jgi:hypothetical protein
VRVNLRIDARQVPWIAPNTVSEKLFSSFVVMIGAIFFASLLGAIVAAIAAIERSNAQRRDKMTLMHNFVATRRLNAALKSGMTRYVDAMFAFNNEVEGIDRLGALPGRLRASLLEVIYAQMLQTCTLLKISSRGTALQICQQLQPQVCLAKSILVEKFAVATHLFLLHRGALHITLGQQNGAENHARKGPHLKGKAGLRVRVCERMGGFVGIYDPYDFSARLPIEVEAVKLTQIFAIERHALIDVFDHVGSDEASGVLAALMKEQQLVLEALKFNRQEGRHPPSCVHNVIPKTLEVRKSCRISERQAENESAVGLIRQRRRSCNNVTIGSLLQQSASVTAAANSADAITATVHMWDDAVNTLKASTNLLEDTSRVYEATVTLILSDCLPTDTLSEKVHL